RRASGASGAGPPAASPGRAMPLPCGMDEHLLQRRARVGRAWAELDGVVVVASGAVVPIPGGADQVYPFVAHSDYYYLAEVDRPGRAVVFDPAEGPEGGWADFAPAVTLDDRIWEGIE